MIKPLPPGAVVALSKKAVMQLRLRVKHSGTVRYIVTGLAPTTWDVTYYTNRRNAMPLNFPNWQARDVDALEFNHLPFFNAQALTPSEGFHAHHCSALDLSAMHGIDVKRDDYVHVYMQHRGDDIVYNYVHEPTLASDSCLVFLLDANKVPLAYMTGPMGDQLNYLDSWVQFGKWLVVNNYWDNLPVLPVSAKPHFADEMDYELYTLLKFAARHPRDPDIHDMLAQYKAKVMAADKAKSKQVDVALLRSSVLAPPPPSQ